MCRYGLMLESFVRQNRFRDDLDVNAVLMAMYQIRHRDSCYLLQRWDIEPFDFDRAFGTRKGLACSSSFAEVDLAEKIMEVVFSRDIVEFEKFNLEKIKKDSQESEIDLSIEVENRLSIKKEIDDRKEVLDEIGGILGKLLDAYKKKEEEE